MRIWSVMVLALATSVAAASASDGARLPLAVSIVPQRFVVERVGGAHVSVEVLVGPGHSPATYEVTPSQAKALAAARAWFVIGVPFEGAWRPRLTAAIPTLRVVDMAAGIHRRPVDRFDGARDGPPDPHVWTSPRLLRQMAASVRDTLAALDPTRADQYRANYDRFAVELDDLDRRVREVLSTARGRGFLVFHPSWGYFADDYGLQQLPIESAGKDPGPRTLARVVSEARRRGLSVVFVQEQFSRSVAEQIARELEGTVVSVDPLAYDFPSNLLGVARAIASHAK